MEWGNRKWFMEEWAMEEYAAGNRKEESGKMNY